MPCHCEIAGGIIRTEGFTVRWSCRVALAATPERVIILLFQVVCRICLPVRIARPGRLSMIATAGRRASVLPVQRRFSCPILLRLGLPMKRALSVRPARLHGGSA